MKGSEFGPRHLRSGRSLPFVVRDVSASSCRGISTPLLNATDSSAGCARSCVARGWSPPWCVTSSCVQRPPRTGRPSRHCKPSLHDSRCGSTRSRREADPRLYRPRLSGGTLAAASCGVSLSTDLLTLRDRSAREARRVARVVARDQAHRSLPSVPRRGLRPRAGSSALTSEHAP